MIFHWQLFLLLILIGVFAPILGFCENSNYDGVRQIRYSWFPFFVITIPMIILSGTRIINMLDFGDTSAYLSAFNESTTSISELVSGFNENTKDRGFLVFTAIVKSLIGSREILYFLLIASICILCVMITYKKYSTNFLVSTFLFIASGDYLQWTFNGIRQFIPVAILFACIGLILKKKYVPLIVIILLLSTIHATALLMLPMIFIVQGKAWNKKTFFLTIVIILSITFVDQFTDLITNFMENTQYSGEVEQYLNTDGTSIQRILVYSIPALLSMIFKKYIDEANDPVINLSSNLCLISALSYILSGFTSGLFLGRIPIYFSLYSYILIPWIIEKVFTDKSVKIVYIAMVCFYILYYYYQVHVIWGL